MERKYNLLVIFVLLLLSFVANYSIRYNYQLPIHSDEYDHLAVISEMSSTGKNVWYDPYITTERPGLRNLELNYDIFLFTIYSLSGLSLEQIPLVVPVIVSFIMSLATFVLVLYLTKKHLPSLLASIFVFFLPNSIAFLGYWFLVPMAFGIAMIPAIAFLFFRGLSSWRYMLLLYIVIINLTLTHAVYTVIFIPIVILYFLFYRSDFTDNWKKIGVALLILLGLTMRFVKWNLFDPIATISQIADWLVWPYGEHTPSYPLMEYLGPIIIVLCIIGIAYILRDMLSKFFKGNPLFAQFSSSPKLLRFSRFLPIFVLTTAFFRIFADFSGICLFGPCRRVQPALTIMALIIASLGVYAIARFLTKFFSSFSSARAAKLFRNLVALTLLFFIFGELTTMPFTYADDPVKGLYHNIEMNEYSALQWMKGNFAKPQLVMALPWASKAVFVVSGLKVVDTGLARYGRSLESLSDISNFFLLDCEKQNKILNKYNPTIVYGGKGFVNCQSLDLIYSKEGVYIYVPNKQE